MAAAIRWPRVLTSVCLAQIIRRQKNPLSALHIFNSAPQRYPSYRHTTAVYSAVISTLSPSLPRHLPHFLSLLSQLSLDSCPSTDSIFASAILALSKANLSNHALDIYNSIPKSNCVSWPLSFHAILNHFVDLDDLDTARKVFVGSARRPEVKFSVSSLNLMLSALCRRGKADLALEVFGEIRELCCCYPDRETYRVLMKGLCDIGRLEDGKHLLYSMLWRISQKGCDADVVVYRTLIDAFVVDGRVGEAEDVLGKVLLKGLKSPKRRRAFQRPELRGLSMAEMKKLVDDALVVRGVRNSASYRAMIMDLYGEGKMKHADKMFDEMVSRGFKPDVALFEVKIAALCREKRATDAAKVLEEEMVERDCVPRVQSYNLVVEGLCNEGKVLRAISYLDKMDRQLGCVARKETFEILINGLCCKNYFLEAARIMERMLRSRYWPGKNIFSNLIQGLCSVGNRFEAVLWLEEMVSCGEVPDDKVWSSMVMMVCPLPSSFTFLLDLTI